MKKNNKNDNHQDGQELSRKLYRSISDSVKRLDDAHSCAQSVGELFTPTLQIQRSRFQEYCERLIFSELALFGRKCEELLWRKAYYDVISACKRLKKKEYSEENLNNIQTHINAAIGHYHHFISRLQHHYNIDVFNFVDFSIINLKRSTTNQKDEELELAKLSIHRSLVYLGDLNRYKLDIYPNWDPGLASRYYSSAINFKPDYGTPHNQMGTLASLQNRTLDAVYHYMCCLSCKFSFDGTENNLLRLFEKNSKVFEEFPLENKENNCIVQLEPSDRVKRFISRFLLLIETWYFNRKYLKIYELCHQTNVDLQECLSYSKPTISDEDFQTDLESVSSDSISSPASLTDDAMFKISVICLLCVTKLQKLQFNQLSMAVAFTLSIYSQLLQIATDHIRDKILNASLVESDSDFQINGDAKSKSRTKISRRRKLKFTNNDNEDEEEESDFSEEEAELDLEFSDSETELVVSSSDEEEETPPKDSKTDTDSENITINGTSLLKPGEKVRKIDPNVMLEIIAEEKSLQCLKILSDWFVGDPEIVKSCGKTTSSLLKQIVELLNLLNVDLESSKLVQFNDFILESKENNSKIVLPEDVLLKGIEIVSNLHKTGERACFRSLTSQEEAVLRIMRFSNFGHDLLKYEETGMSFDTENSMFKIQETCPEDITTEDGGMKNLEILEAENDGVLNETTKNSESKQNQMKHMGQLWLAAEVRALESRVRSKTSLSPYLVLDVECLIQYTPIVKHLINSKKFIVVVPSIVVSALDDLKREKIEARDAIRWLEMQFHHGNRFCRAQRPQECTSLPLIKYPKKKDKESFMYIQIIECCYYLMQQQRSSSSLVTLLMGNKNALSNCENREISYVGLARSAEINLELVTDFYQKWKKTYKGKK